MNREWLLSCLLLLASGSANAAEKVLCELQGAARGERAIIIQFVHVQEGCAMEGEPRTDCYIARKKEGALEVLGEGVIRKGIPANTLCLAPRLLSSDAAEVSLVCDERGLPRSVRLRGPGGAVKTCALPKAFPKELQ